MRQSIKERVSLWHNQNPSFAWKNGKWFLGDNEIGKSRIDRYLLCNTDCRDVNDCGKWRECFIALYGDDEADWGELPIVRLARQMLAEGKKPEKLAYPLNEKELKLFNYVLCGEPEYAIFFYGIGGSGKSSICNILCKIFGEDNCCYTSLQDLSRFNIELEGARLWFDDDISPYWSDAKSARFKPMVTNGHASFEEKGRTPHNGQYRCKCVFASNHPVKFDVTDTGMLRRIIYYKKDKKIENPDKALANKEYTYQELLNIVMAVLSVDMTDWEQDFIEDTRTTIMDNNTVWKYGMGSNYTTYCETCATAGYTPYGRDKWQEIQELFEEWKDECDTSDI